MEVKEDARRVEELSAEKTELENQMKESEQSNQKLVNDLLDENENTKDEKTKIENDLKDANDDLDKSKT